jgi:phage gpG-like protein
MGLGLALTIKDEATPALRVIPKKMTKTIRARLPNAGQIVTNFWKRTLSGPATARRLGVGTGALRSSIRWAMRGPSEVVVGTHLPYASVHEFGFRGRVGVRAHTRQPRNRVAHAVRAHTRTANIPQRPHRAPAVKLASRSLTTLFLVGVKQALEEARVEGKRLGKEQKALAATLGAAARRTRG